MQSRVFERICLLCEKAKYLKGTKTREALIQSVDLRADSTIRRAAVGKNDPRILAIVTRELVAAEACYHKSCYRDYTRNVQGAVSSGDKKEEDECPEYTNAESQAQENSERDEGSESEYRNIQAGHKIKSEENSCVAQRTIKHS